MALFGTVTAGAALAFHGNEEQPHPGQATRPLLEQAAHMNQAEELAQWYFRLNGFLTLPNFVLHPSRQGSQRTDADIIGIRFPHRRELSADAIDDELFATLQQPYLVLVEVKSKYAALNETWTDKSRENIQAILKAIGLFSAQRVEEVAQALYKCGIWKPDDGIACSFFLVADCADRVPQQYAAVPCRTWDEVLTFICSRFNKFAKLKSQNEQWGAFGQMLWQLATENHNEYQFRTEARKMFCLPDGPVD